jgi:uroporphyrinogen decarboxylase
MLHSCGKINEFVPYFLQAGVDVVNMGQPQTYGIRELGGCFAGKICFLSTADIQKTLPGGDLEKIRAEVRELVASWSTADGGFIVFNYGMGGAIGVSEAVTREMFLEFGRQMNHWNRGS